MSNPLAEYVAPAPVFDYSDARTWYDGLWGGGQWPPEGYPGHPAIHGLRGLDQNLAIWNQPAAWMPGDLARLRAASLRGLGAATDLSSCSNIGCPDYPDMSTCVCADNIPQVDVYQIASQGKLLSQSQYLGSMPTPNTPTTGSGAPQTLSTQTWVMLGMGAAVVLLLIMAVKR